MRRIAGQIFAITLATSASHNLVVTEEQRALLVLFQLG
jgi:hypothetical protein